MATTTKSTTAASSGKLAGENNSVERNATAEATVDDSSSPPSFLPSLAYEAENSDKPCSAVSKPANVTAAKRTAPRHRRARTPEDVEKKEPAPSSLETTRGRPTASTPSSYNSIEEELEIVDQQQSEELEEVIRRSMEEPGSAGFTTTTTSSDNMAALKAPPSDEQATIPAAATPNPMLLNLEKQGLHRSSNPDNAMTGNHQPGAYHAYGRAFGDRPFWDHQQQSPSLELAPAQHEEWSQRAPGGIAPSSAIPEANEHRLQVIQVPSRSNAERMSQAYLLEATLVESKRFSGQDVHVETEEEDDCENPPSANFHSTSRTTIVVADAIPEPPCARKRWVIPFLVLMMFLVLVGVVVGSVLGTRSKKDSPSSDSNSQWNQVIASVPETICNLRYPGAGQSPDCDVNETITHGGGVGNLVAQAFLAQVQLGDVAIQNAGACRADILKGNFTINDARQVIPFKDLLQTFHMTGQQIIEAMEGALNYIYHGPGGYTKPNTGGYPYAAGLRYDVNMSADYGQRVSNIEVNIRLEQTKWTPLELNRSYMVVATSYLGNGGDNYTQFGQVTATDSHLDSTDTLINYAIVEKVLRNPPLSEYSTKSYVPDPNASTTTPP